MEKSALRQNGNTKITILVLILVIIGGAFIFRENFFSSQKVGDLPPINKRVNPEPQSANKVFVKSVNPGTEVVVDEVEVNEDGYLYVYKDVNGSRQNVGKSELLSQGSHAMVKIITKTLKDGDIIYVSLHSLTGKEVADVNGNAIEVLKNVGLAMGHYDSSEY